MTRSFALAALLAGLAAASMTPGYAREEAAKLGAQQQAAPAKDQKSFIREAIRGNLAEIDMGKLAQRRSSNQGVKAFGRMLVEDHSAANEKARAIAQELKVTPPTRPTLKQRATYAAQSATRGATFDRKFVQHMVTDHQKDIAAYQAQAQSGAEPTASMAKEILPTLEKHLAEAQRLQTEITAQRR